MKTNLNVLMILILLATLMGGTAGSVQAANPDAGSYIIVFKNVADPTAQAQGVANAYGIPGRSRP